jgi:5-methylcytosine-specific restriction endonuclease McrA
MESTKFTDPTGKEWGSEREFIMWLFNGRCVSCKRKATEVNHIIPKGRGDEHCTWKNQVPLCSECHVPVYHHNGVTDDKIVILKKQRAAFLVALNRSEFI